MQGNGEDRGRAGRSGGAANDNSGSETPGSVPGQAEAEARIDAAVMRLARLIGRQIAREEFAPPEAANDNAPEGEAHET